jgi:hypothetical protein
MGLKKRYHDSIAGRVAPLAVGMFLAAGLVSSPVASADTYAASSGAIQPFASSTCFVGSSGTCTTAAVVANGADISWTSASTIVCGRRHALGGFETSTMVSWSGLARWGRRAATAIGLAVCTACINSSSGVAPCRPAETSTTPEGT